MLLQARLSGAPFALAAAALLLAAAPADAARRKFTVYVPCGMELPFMAAKEAFETANPDAAARLELDNADILVQRVLQKGERPDVIVSPGAIEMDALVAAGKVAAGDVRRFGRYELTLFTPRDNPGHVSDFRDLAKPEVKTVALANPRQNSVGRYTRQALENLGLWEKVEPKLLLSDHPIDAYKQVAQRRAEASFAYRTCPLQSAPEKLAYSKVRIIKSVPFELYDPAYATVGILKESAERALAQRFVAFLLSETGQKALSENGVPSMVEVVVFVPCGMISALMEAKAAYEKERPLVTLRLEFDRIDKLVETALKGPAPDALLSTGPVEVEPLIAAGRFEKTALRPLGRFELALCANARLKDVITRVEDLAKPEVKTISLTPPAHSSVGRQAVAALAKLGLWDKVKDKVTYLPAVKDCYAAVAGGRADAGFGYVGCPIIVDPKRAAYSKVVAVQTIDAQLYGGAEVVAAVLKDARHAREAGEFLRFLVSPQGMERLKLSGVTPLADAK